MKPCATCGGTITDGVWAPGGKGRSWKPCNPCMRSVAAAMFGRMGGQVGGKATGAAKRRGSSEFYRALAVKSAKARKRNRKAEGR